MRGQRDARPLLATGLTTLPPRPSLVSNKRWKALELSATRAKAEGRIDCPRRTVLRTLTKLGHTAPAMDRLLLVDAVQLPL